MMAVERDRRFRIAVALDPAAPIESVLRAGLILGGPSSRLVGLFVEDKEIVDFARSGLAREVTTVGVSRPLVGTRLIRQFERRSREVRLSFERGAQTLGLHYSFEILRGSAIEQLTLRLKDLDALIVSRAYRRAGVRSWYGLPVHRLAETPARLLLFVQEEWATGRRVVVLAPEGERARDLLTLARDIAAAEGLEAVLLVEPGKEQPAQEGFLVHRLFRDEPADVAAALRLEDARVLLLPREHSLASGSRLAELLRRIDSSVLIA